MIWNLIRWPLGQLILLVDFLTSPRAPQRAPYEQAKIDQATCGPFSPPLGQQEPIPRAIKITGPGHHLFGKTGPAFIKQWRFDRSPERPLQVPAA